MHTEEELAASLQITGDILPAIVEGRYTPSLELADKIAHYFECEIAEVVVLDKDEHVEVLFEKHRKKHVTSLWIWSVFAIIFAILPLAMHSLFWISPTLE